MDNKLFKETEGLLYRYYEYKLNKNRLEREIESIQLTLKDIESDIKTANVNIDYYQSGMQISERVQTSSTGSSHAETEICKEIGRLEREHKKEFRKLLRKKYELRAYKKLIEFMDENIRTLSEEDKRFLELKYGDKNNIIQISMKLNIAKSTAYRKREELIENISRFTKRSEQLRFVCRISIS